jgi:hypothetical protein
MSAYTEELDSILSDWGNRVADRIKSNLDTTGTTASGRTKDSIEVVAIDGELTIYGRRFFEGVETGRPAGKIPYKFQDIIRQWMDDKGIADQFGQKEWQKRNAAYLIAQKIKDSGTKLYRDGGRTSIYTDVITEMLPELEEKLTIAVKESILRDM